MNHLMTVLIVDDDKITQTIIGAYCEQKNLSIHYANSGIEALEIIYREKIDLVITDIRMPGMDGKILLQKIKNFSKKLPVLLMTAHSSIDEAVTLLKSGAEDYIPKPISPEVLNHRLDVILNNLTLAAELADLKLKDGKTFVIESLIGSAPTFSALIERLPLVAQTDAAILISGESGTGKELVARAVHSLSKRSAKNFVTVNCGALPDNLLESELFGYKKGAFTDAHQDTPGLVEEAENGTLFLDEIGEISSVVQVKLLRFLQNKEYKQLGSPKIKKANVRIICATNRNLPTMVKNNQFREDLFYRLNIVPLRVPPLRERKTDIPILANHFLATFNREYDKKLESMSPQFIESLMQQSWPGNVRELENKIQQLVVLSQPSETLLDDGQVIPNDFSLQSAPPIQHFKNEKKRVLDNFERSYIQRMLELTEGNLSEAAKRAGMDRKNFWQKAQRHNIKKSKQSPIY